MCSIFFHVLCVVLFLAPASALAHEVSGTGFFSGLEHPVLGPDHLLAMLSVGLLSAQIGGRALWTVPATFVSVMLLGGIVGIFHIPVPFVEYGIVTSVVVLGMAIALDKKIPIAASMGFVGFFAIFHGHAHGTEIPNFAEPLYYSLGFVAGTACIHLVGVLIGYLAMLSKPSSYFLRFLGIVIAIRGVQLYVGS